MTESRRPPFWVEPETLFLANRPGLSPPTAGSSVDVAITEVRDSLAKAIGEISRNSVRSSVRRFGGRALAERVREPDLRLSLVMGSKSAAELEAIVTEQVRRDLYAQLGVPVDPTKIDRLPPLLLKAYSSQMDGTRGSVARACNAVCHHIEILATLTTAALARGLKPPFLGRVRSFIGQVLIGQ